MEFLFCQLEAYLSELESLLQFFCLIVPSYFSFILIVYLLGEVDAFTVGSTFLIYAILASLSLTPRTLGSSSLHNLRKLFASSLGSSSLHPSTTKPRRTSVSS